eukprot:2230330-Pyramimonas_sp.AAC.2
MLPSAKIERMVKNYPEILDLTAGPRKCRATDFALQPSGSITACSYRNLCLPDQVGNVMADLCDALVGRSDATLETLIQMVSSEPRLLW